jgi:hypothetical protein
MARVMNDGVGRLDAAGFAGESGDGAGDFRD